MNCQLNEFVGKMIEIGSGKPRRYMVEGISCDGDIALATIKAPRTTYTAVRCNKARVIGRPGAETWSILGSGGRTVANFAIFNGEVLTLS